MDVVSRLVIMAALDEYAAAHPGLARQVDWAQTSLLTEWDGSVAVGEDA